MLSEWDRAFLSELGESDDWRFALNLTDDPCERTKILSTIDRLETGEVLEPESDW